MSINQSIVLLSCTTVLDNVKRPLIDCIAARIPDRDWYYGIDTEKRNKMVIFSGNYQFLRKGYWTLMKIE